MTRCCGHAIVGTRCARCGRLLCAWHFVLGLFSEAAPATAPTLRPQCHPRCGYDFSKVKEWRPA